MYTNGSVDILGRPCANVLLFLLIAAFCLSLNPAGSEELEI